MERNFQKSMAQQTMTWRPHTAESFKSVTKFAHTQMDECGAVMRLINARRHTSVFR